MGSLGRGLLMWRRMGLEEGDFATIKQTDRQSGSLDLFGNRGVFAKNRSRRFLSSIRRDFEIANVFWFR